MVDLYDGDQRALPIVQGIAGIAETERDRPVNPLPDPAPSSGADPGAEFRRLVEAGAARAGAGVVARRDPRRLDGRRAAAVVHGRRQRPPAVLRPRRDLRQKAFQLLDGSAGSAPTPFCRTSCRRSSTAPARTRCRTCARSRGRSPASTSMRWRRRCRPDVARRRLAAGRRSSGGVATGRLHAAVAALRDGAGVDGVLDVVVDAVGRADAALRPGRRVRLPRRLRLARHHPRDDLRQRRALARTATRHPDTVRLALWCVFLAHWTGRHEWHTRVGRARRRTTVDTRLVAAGEALQREALLDNATVVHRPRPRRQDRPRRGREAVRSGSVLPLQAAARFLDSPRARSDLWPRRDPLDRVPVRAGTPRRLGLRPRHIPSIDLMLRSSWSIRQGWMDS